MATKMIALTRANARPKPGTKTEKNSKQLTRNCGPMRTRNEHKLQCILSMNLLKPAETPLWGLFIFVCGGGCKFFLLRRRRRCGFQRDLVETIQRCWLGREGT